MNEEYTLSTPFVGRLHDLGFSVNNNPHYYDSSTLFWSLTRLFSYYERIIRPIYTAQSYFHPFIESDIENYIIRQRIILNDIAYIVRQLLPNTIRGLKGLNDGAKSKNIEMSIMDLYKYLEKNTTEFEGLHEIIKKNMVWILKLRKQRDRIIHYKAKVLLFETKPDISFAILDPSGKVETITTPEGEQKLVLTPVVEFINSQTKSLWEFINIDLSKWLEDYIKRNNISYIEVGKDSRMSCVGIPLFREINGIK